MTQGGGDPDPSEEELDTWMQRYMHRQRDALKHSDETSGPGAAESALRDHILRAAAGEAAPSAASVSVSRVPWARLAAAVLVVSLGATWYFGGFDGRSPEVILGVGDLEALEPVGPVRSFDSFRWEGTVPQGGYVKVFISPGDGTPLVESPALDDTVWAPPAATTEGWTTIEWWVESFAGSNQPSSEARSRPVVASIQ